MIDPLEHPPADSGDDTARELERADQQAILDNLPALIAYWDRGLRNRLANKVYVEYFDMTPEEIFGRHISEVLGPDLYQQNLPYLERALAGERQEFDREIPTPTGPRYTQALYLPDVHEGEVRGIFVLVTDISARRRAEVALALAESRFRTLFEAAPSATLVTSADGLIVSANDAAGRLFGYDVAALEGMDVDALVHPADLAMSRRVRDQLTAGRITRFSEERRYRHADGHTVWAQAEVTVVRATDPDDDRPYLLAQLQDTSTRKSYEHELEHLAHHDALTGTLNRRGLTRVLERQVVLAESGRGGSVLLCDLDNFKAVNDRFGHEVGDDLLVHVARVLRRAVRASDAVGRLGGDEFAVVLSRAGAEDARTVGATVARSLEEDAGFPWNGVSVSISIGVAQFSPGRTIDQVLREADRDMYAVKAAGRERRSRPAAHQLVTRTESHPKKA
ncbi:diguanylate cyclase [Nocardioides sp. QY071]|uniref:sensor domain-containing diguanylate cyclase n=1 Tax=Nocardioides sp. QY071 TaxID=3044187 RepID=UPI00249A9F0F|nr:diguanylate cyclase [Nocardioides sp. QY071]WGY04230.1 diguanylate cyclase [Nocardioides sp. QY071]